MELLVVAPISTNAAGAPFSKVFRVRRAAFALGDCKNASKTFTSTDSEVVHFSELPLKTRGMSTDGARQAVRDALAHREPSHVPIDFGSTAVTGIHVSVVAGLREYYGLEKRPVKVSESYQMLGLIEDDLAEAMGIDTKGYLTQRRSSGSR